MVWWNSKRRCLKIGDEKLLPDVYAIEADLVASANLNATASQKRKSN
jgi:hypothetical protein